MLETQKVGLRAVLGQDAHLQRFLNDMEFVQALTSLQDEDTAQRVFTALIDELQTYLTLLHFPSFRETCLLNPVALLAAIRTQLGKLKDVRETKQEADMRRRRDLRYQQEGTGDTVSKLFSQQFWAEQRAIREEENILQAMRLPLLIYLDNLDDGEMLSSKETAGGLVELLAQDSLLQHLLNDPEFRQAIPMLADDAAFDFVLAIVTNTLKYALVRDDWQGGQPLPHGFNPHHLRQAAKTTVIQLDQAHEHPAQSMADEHAHRSYEREQAIVQAIRVIVLLYFDDLEHGAVTLWRYNMNQIRYW